MARSCSFVCVFPLLLEPDEDVPRPLDRRLDADEPRELDDEPLLPDFEPLLAVARRLDPEPREEPDRAPVDEAREPRVRDEPLLAVDEDFSPSLVP